MMITPPKNQLDKIEHVVVLMLENRSFDNILGYLYSPDNPPPFNKKPPANFEGVYGKNLSNPGPGNKTYPVAPGNVLTNPNPDPGEPYEDIYSQLYNVPAPSLGNVPPNPPQPPKMQGFANNYAAQPDVT